MVGAAATSIEWTVWIAWMSTLEGLKAVWNTDRANGCSLGRDEPW